MPQSAGIRRFDRPPWTNRGLDAACTRTDRIVVRTDRRPLNRDESAPSRQSGRNVLRLVTSPSIERFTGKITWLSRDRRHGVVAGVGGDSFRFDSSHGGGDPSFAAGDLVSYEQLSHDGRPDTANAIRSLRRRAADRPQAHKQQGDSLCPQQSQS